MKIFYKKNENNRIIEIMTSFNDSEEGYLDSSKLKNAHKDLLWSLVEDDTVVYDDEYVEYYKTDPPIINEDEAIVIIQLELDDQARNYKFDSIFTASTYLNSAVPKFKKDAIALVAWRDHTWSWLYNLYDKIQEGEFPAITKEELLEKMPKFIPPIEE